MGKILLSLLLFVSLIPFNAYTQEAGPEYLGIWCYIDINLSNDPVNDTYLEYYFVEPPEGIGRFLYNYDGYYCDNDDEFFGEGYFNILENGTLSINGPGMPFLTKENGMVKLHLNKDALEVEMHRHWDYPFVDLELPVKKTVAILGGGYQQCYYISDSLLLPK